MNLSTGNKSRFHVVLIRPSKYDKDGYVLSWLRGMMASNSLALMNALTEQAARDRVLGPGVDIITHFLDETVTRISAGRIADQVRAPGDRAIVCMVGVQTNQFPRAVDLGREFMAHGLKVMIGGFHVSGCLAMLPGVPGDIQEAMDDGITMVAGEVEDQWGGLLRGAYNNTLKPLYNFLGEMPELKNAPCPFVTQDKLRFYLQSRQSSLDSGRGCPFKCSFCSVINVQGRSVRARSGDDVEALMRRNHKERVREYFITDDNFARNPNWEEIIDRVIHLREKEGIRANLIIQTDAASHRIPRFIEKLTRAGCRRVFIGLETVNPDNLAAAKKNQNRISEYRTTLQAWRDNGVLTCAGYILGFPGDTYESIMRDVDFLKKELPLDLALFQIMTPVPGSEDHQKYYLNGIGMEEDMNEYDSTVPCVEHPIMSRQELLNAYHDAWKSFYSREHVETLLERRKDRRKKTLALVTCWFRVAIFVEDVHPYQIGLFRLKGRKRRSPRFPVESMHAYVWRRTKDVVKWFLHTSRVLLEVRYLYWKTGGPEH